MTTPCARASSPPSNASSSTDSASALRPRHAGPYSNSSRDGTIPAEDIRRSATCRPSTTKGVCYPPLAQVRNSPRNRGNSRHAYLQEANLVGANLQGAVLRGADLEAADFNGAKLQGADLSNVNNLIQDQLDSACGDEETLLSEALTISTCPE